MWYYDSKIIKTPKAMVISEITHPPGIFRDSTMLASLGIKPYTETRKDNRYYSKVILYGVTGYNKQTLNANNQLVPIRVVKNPDTRA